MCASVFALAKTDTRCPHWKDPRYLRGAYIMNHKKLLLTLTLCLCALLCMVVTASASEVQNTGSHSHELCKKTVCTNPEHIKSGTHGSVTFATELRQDGNTLYIGEDKWEYDSVLEAYILPAGTYYLGTNLTLNHRIQIQNSGGEVTLCLNGNTVMCTSNGAVIQTPTGAYSANFTLCDCQPNGSVGKITHKTGATGSGVDLQRAANTPAHTFIMYNGCITGNTSTSGGGGVSVADSTTFTMYGGSIVDNKANPGRYASNGGGVYVAGGDTENKYFTMYGGSITGNHTAGDGGGIYSTSNNISIYGGSVTGNSTERNGGAVYVAGTMIVGGDINISGNWKGDAQSSASNDNANNVYLSANSTITIEKALTGSSIGVTTATEPGTGSNVTFANSSTNTITTGIFTPDTAGVLVGVAADGKSAYLYKCDHSKNTNKTWEAGSSNHWQVCSICGCKANEASHNMVEKDAKAPTCTSAGWDAYNACEVCGYKSGYKEIAALDHDMKNHDAQSPTCTETGHTAYRKCDRSGCNYKEGYELIPKLNHAFAAAWEHNDDKHWHKCTRDGCTGIDAEAAHEWQPATYTAPKTCTVCGATTGTKLSAYYYYSPAKTEDTPGSPKAGDPGVLLYAGLALASLTGLACTAKKRH